MNADTTTLTGPISGEDYMQVLLARQAAFVAEHDELLYLPLLEWFIRDEDVEYVVLTESVPTPKRKPKPRVYRSAASIREELERVTAQRDAIGGSDIPDRAAANLSPFARSKAAARAGRRRFAQMDRDLEKFTRLTKRIDQLASQLINAEAREKPSA